MRAGCAGPTGEQASLGYLVVLDERGGAMSAGLLVVNASAEPLAFCSNRGTCGRALLWAGRAGRDRLIRELVRTLVDASPVDFIALLVAGPGVELALCESSVIPTAVAADGKLRWFGERPDERGDVAALVGLFESRALLMEPFDRARAGLAAAGAP